MSSIVYVQKPQKRERERAIWTDWGNRVFLSSFIMHARPYLCMYLFA